MTDMAETRIGQPQGDSHIPQAEDQEERRLWDRVEGYEEDDGYYEREDALFWVPHQQGPGKMVQFDGFTATIDDIITQCGYREKDREWLTEVHRRSMKSFLKSYRGVINGRIPLLEEA